MLSIIQAAGWPIWPLILCSILALALIIERLVQLRMHKVVPPKTLEQAVEISRRGVPSEEMVLKLENKGVLGPVLASGLRCLQKNPAAADEDIRAHMEMAGRLAGRQLERYLTALGTIASAAPLLGLLGTVIGMIEIFAAQTAGTSQPAQLAYGISIALYNTAFGLIVAIPALMFWRYFRSLVDNMLLSMEVASEQFARHLSHLRN
ncbi:MotA/TolQ/ExbB proton channel family protein [Limnohabitans sp. Rim8]|uniref:MotA/TolQ/ExbB proton channel family protein n=1 Tax=Limnohabitans sp. Rim8 TaxID=1100718 RepID=UPI002600F23A|nr:MotA/TolQ/ExbB proton channel family protein [Limnohabitans sp. Rim8]